MFFRSPNQVIQNVVFDEQSQFVYSDQDMYDNIAEFFSGKNIRLLSYSNKQDFEDSILSNYKIIENIAVSKTEQDWTIYVELQFVQPLLWFSNENKNWIAWENETYEITTADNIQENSYQVHLPWYTDSYESLSWMFYHIHDETLFGIIENINDIVDPAGVSRLEYDPGWKKLHITYNDKLILFHLDKSIDSQLSKLLDIQQYYNQYDQVRKIDLGSSDDIIVL